MTKLALEGLWGETKRRITAKQGQVHYDTTSYRAPNAAAVPPGLCERTERAGCPRGQFGLDRKTGPISPTGPQTSQALGWLFEVVAPLSAGTRNPNQCTQGQIARGTNTITDIKGTVHDIRNSPAQALPAPAGGNLAVPGGNFAVVSAPNAVPAFAAANFGAANCTTPFLLQRHHANTIWAWIDQPQVAFGVPAITAAATQRPSCLFRHRKSLHVLVPVHASAPTEPSGGTASHRRRRPGDRRARSRPQLPGHAAYSKRRDGCRRRLRLLSA